MYPPPLIPDEVQCAADALPYVKPRPPCIVAGTTPVDRKLPDRGAWPVCCRSGLDAEPRALPVVMTANTGLPLLEHRRQGLF